MTQFVNGSFGLPVTVLARNDYSICDQQYFPRWRYTIPANPNTGDLRNAHNAADWASYSTRWWPRSGPIVGGWTGSGEDVFQSKPGQWMPPRIERGANGRLAFVGYTRDQYGSPLGGCTVRCYRASTEELVSKVTSDANGLYFATSPYNDAHFLVIHNPAGDQAGATKNTLTPS